MPQRQHDTPADRAPIVTQLGRRLRIRFGPRATDNSTEPLDEATPPPAPQLEFLAYAEDCVLAGWIRLTTERLTDLLNSHDEYELVDVRAEGFDTAEAMEVRSVIVPRSDLSLVQAVGPRGPRDRRLRTRQHPIAVQVGRYQVRGYLHALPGADPILSFQRRGAMVPLTNASIEFSHGGTVQRRSAATVIVNRQRVDWVAQALDREVEYPDMPQSTDAAGPLLKDFTGGITSG